MHLFVLGVLAGTHYNRAWNIHSTVAEALERLLISRFIWDRNITFSDDINDYFADGCYDSFDDAIVDMLGPLAYQYESYKEKARSGELGKTPQYWLIYLDLMYLQTMVHSAVQENDIDKLGFAWYSFLPYYFVLDKQNYARYGSYYVTMLRNMDATYPGLKSLIDKKGISVQGQDRYPLRTSVDQRGEQTINKDAKTAGMLIISCLFFEFQSIIRRWTIITF